MAPERRPRPPRAHRGVLRAAAGATASPSTSSIPARRPVRLPAGDRAAELPASSAQAAKNLDDYVGAGGTLLVSYFTGVVDENDARARRGAVRARSARPSASRSRSSRRCGTATAVTHRAGRPRHRSPADVWTDRLRPGPDTEVVATFVDGPAAGGAAVTRHPLGAGAAWYVATRLDPDGLARLVRRVRDDAGVRAGAGGRGPRGGHPRRRPRDVRLRDQPRRRRPRAATSAAPSCSPASTVDGRLVVTSGDVRVVRTP